MSLSLLNRSPEPGEYQVPIDTLIELDVTNTESGGIDASQTTVYVEGVIAYQAGSFQTGFDGPSSSATTLTPHTLRIIIDPTSDFASLQVVTVRVVSESVGGTYTIDQSYDFTIEDLTASEVLSVVAIDLDQIEIIFDEEMDEDSALEISNYSIARTAASAPSVSAEVESVEKVNASTFLLTTDINLTHGATYELSISGVEDAFGNTIDPTTIDFTGYTPPVPEDRDFNLWQMFPRMNRNEDITRDLWKTLAVLQEVTDQLLFGIDAWTEILDPDLAPEPFVDAMLHDMGNPFSFPLELIDKRRLLRVLVEIYRQKGTAKGIKNVVRFFLGFEIEITAYEAIGLVLGESELGIDWELGIGDQRAAYTFLVTLAFNPTEEQRKRLIRIVEYMKPVNTHLGEVEEPEQPDIFDHWELGESELGETTDLH